MSIAPKKMAILVGGGPAPGINSVIGAATIRAAVEGIEVIGVRDGFKWIMDGDITRVKELTIKNVSRIHFRGGSFIGIARANPTLDEKLLENTVTSLLRLNVDKLITVGGDDTAYSALKVNEMAARRISVVHVPKTIDNDLDLPHGIPTFGFQTARHIGVEVVKNLMVDAQTTSRWYFVISMGRKAGHLALGIGKATGSTITLIPEEFPGDEIKLSHIVDVLVGAIIKRLSYGRTDGVAIIAEGLVERLSVTDLENLNDIERDAHDNLRIAEVNFGEILKMKVQEKLKEFNLKTTIVSKDIGYELRCADPIPFDMEYTRDILDPKTNRTRVRMVDPSSEAFYIARRYMLRLNQADFDDPHELAKLAATAGISVKEFEKRFYYLIENDLLYKHIRDGAILLTSAETNIAHEPIGELIDDNSHDIDQPKIHPE
jgi:6-phosphofructokinase